MRILGIAGKNSLTHPMTNQWSLEKIASTETYFYKVALTIYVAICQIEYGDDPQNIGGMYLQNVDSFTILQASGTTLP
jgi:hypothetical protein